MVIVARIVNPRLIEFPHFLNARIDETLSATIFPIGELCLETAIGNNEKENLLFQR